MKLDVIFLPRELQSGHLTDRSVAVFDVLRASTTMTAALAAGVREIRIYPSLPAAAGAAAEFGPDRLLCGEQKCVRPAGFDLGNSPGQFSPPLHRGRTVFLCTTNGTRAVEAARGAQHLFVGALVNASAVARKLLQMDLDVTLLCAGTSGEIAMDDLLGAGAVVDALAQISRLEDLDDPAALALRLFRSARDELAAALAESRGGKNLLAAGLAGDIEFAARLDSIPTVGRVDPAVGGGLLTLRAAEMD